MIEDFNFIGSGTSYFLVCAQYNKHLIPLLGLLKVLED